MQVVVMEEGEEGKTTPLMRRRKANAPQGSTVDPLILINAIEEKVRRRKEEEDK